MKRHQDCLANGFLSNRYLVPHAAVFSLCFVAKREKLQALKLSRWTAARGHGQRSRSAITGSGRVTFCFLGSICSHGTRTVGQKLHLVGHFDRENSTLIGSCLTISAFLYKKIVRLSAGADVIIVAVIPMLRLVRYGFNSQVLSSYESGYNHLIVAYNSTNYTPSGQSLIKPTGRKTNVPPFLKSTVICDSAVIGRVQDCLRLRVQIARRASRRYSLWKTNVLGSTMLIFENKGNYVGVSSSYPKRIFL